jgi:hypothetical protein
VAVPTATMSTVTGKLNPFIVASSLMGNFLDPLHLLFVKNVFKNVKNVPLPEPPHPTMDLRQLLEGTSEDDIKGIFFGTDALAAELQRIAYSALDYSQTCPAITVTLYKNASSAMLK